MQPQEVKEKLERRGAQGLNQDEVRFALEYDLLTESQIVTDLGLDSPKKVQAVLAGGEVFDPASVQASGNHMTLTPEEEALIERRRERAESGKEPQPKIKVSTANADYEEMRNNDLRSELADRGLSVDGRKEDLVARLVRSDNDALEEGDKAPTE